MNAGPSGNLAPGECTMAPLVEDIFGEQVKVDGRWYHAERIFGRPTDSFEIGKPVPELAQGGAKDRAADPDIVLAPDLFRENGANITSQTKVDAYLDAMRGYGGWGTFPPVSGYVETLTMLDVQRFQELKAQGCHSELGWSREITVADVGRRYVHLTEGHHRSHAGMRYQQEGGVILVPVYDLAVEESCSRYMVCR